MKLIADIYRERVGNEKLNTSYPLSPSDWHKYRDDKSLSFTNSDVLSFYIHIPFCCHLCSFCEYTRMLCPDEQTQQHYLDTLERDIECFLSDHRNIELKGFDIGGGTPTALSEKNFALLIDIYRRVVDTVKLSADFEPSSEATFQTLSVEKLKRISGAGIKRLSLGVQSSNKRVLHSHKRAYISVEKMREWMATAKSVGIEKINLDLMYGLKGQLLDDVACDIEMIEILAPEQITLYELRVNMLANDKPPMLKEELFEIYKLFYDAFSAMSYNGGFGQNTFSIDKSDFGVSSYLRSRMFEGIDYKGFGVSAQSMSRDGVSYNIGKNSSSLSNYIHLSSYNEEYTYLLPKREILSKFIAISAYSGRFSLKVATEILGENSINYFQQQIDFCIDNNLMTLDDNTLLVTKKGFLNYGALFSLFYLG